MTKIYKKMPKLASGTTLSRFAQWHTTLYNMVNILLWDVVLVILGFNMCSHCLSILIHFLKAYRTTNTHRANQLNVQTAIRRINLWGKRPDTGWLTNLRTTQENEDDERAKYLLHDKLISKCFYLFLCQKKGSKRPPNAMHWQCICWTSMVHLVKVPV